MCIVHRSNVSHLTSAREVLVLNQIRVVSSSHKTKCSAVQHRQKQAVMEITAASFTNEAFANLQPRRPRVAKDPSLPVLAARDEVLAAVRGHSTVLVVGETGSGKSTQVPQFLLDAKS